MADSASQEISSVFMSKMADDMVKEILMWLPERRDVIRCSSVCKHWLSLISDPQFKNAIDKPLASLLFQWQENSYLRTRCDPKFYQLVFDKNMDSSSSCLDFLPWNDFAIRASYDDLLLLSRPDSDILPDNCLLYICNPVTKKWWGLPKAPPPGIKKLLKFGLIKNEYDHTVVLLGCKTDRYMGYVTTVWVTMFSSTTREWSPFAVVPSEAHPVHYHAFNQLFLLGSALHWVCGSAKWRTIVSFDPLAGGGRGWRYIARPVDAGSTLDSFRVRVGVCRGRLRVGAVHSCGQGGFILRVWEYGVDMAWAAVHSAALDGVEGQRCIFLLAHHPSDSDVVFLSSNLFRVYRYYMKQGKAEKVGEFPVQVPGLPEHISVHALCSSWPTHVPSFQ